MESLIITLLEIYRGVQQWKNFENRIRFDKVIDISSLPRFLWNTVYIHFCQVRNLLCVQVLCSPVLASLLHGTLAVVISQTLQCGIFTQQGSHPVRHWAVKLSRIFFYHSPLQLSIFALMYMYFILEVIIMATLFFCLVSFFFFLLSCFLLA